MNPSAAAIEAAKPFIDHFHLDEDGWYSCPMHPEALRRPNPKVCDCGYAARLNALAFAFDAFKAAK